MNKEEALDFAKKVILLDLDTKLVRAEHDWGAEQDSSKRLPILQRITRLRNAKAVISNLDTSALLEDHGNEV